MLYHGLSLRPELPDGGEDVAAALPLDLLDQDGEAHVHAAAVRPVPAHVTRGVRSDK